MSVANCKTVCREIEEAEYGESLTASVREHLPGCRQCQRFFDERLKLRQLVASLETVAAPADFDLRVRTRIANERVSARAGFSFNNFAFGLPSVALASLVLAVGLVVALRVWNAPITTNTVSVHNETPKPKASVPESKPSPSTELGARSGVSTRELATTRHDGIAPIRQGRQPKKRGSFRSGVASLKNGERLATKEFSTTQAPVIKQEEAVASLESPIFQIETSSQPLRLSLDYSGGISRTISVPALSFGSEGVLTSGSGPLVKNSPKGAW